MKKAVNVIVALAACLLVAYLLPALVMSAALILEGPAHDTCTTTVLAAIVGVSGYDFEIQDRDCDLIANLDEVTVVVSRNGGTEKAPIFRYIPWKQPVVPRIEVIGERKVRISLAKVSSVDLCAESWQGLTIIYDVDHVSYPSNPGGAERCLDGSRASSQRP